MGYTEQDIAQMASTISLVKSEIKNYKHSEYANTMKYLEMVQELLRRASGIEGRI